MGNDGAWLVDDLKGMGVDTADIQTVEKVRLSVYLALLLPGLDESMADVVFGAYRNPRAVR